MQNVLDLLHNGKERSEKRKIWVEIFISIFHSHPFCCQLCGCDLNYVNFQAAQSLSTLKIELTGEVRVLQASEKRRKREVERQRHEISEISCKAFVCMCRKKKEVSSRYSHSASLSFHSTHNLWCNLQSALWCNANKHNRIYVLIKTHLDSIIVYPALLSLCGA